MGVSRHIQPLRRLSLGGASRLAARAGALLLLLGLAVASRRARSARPGREGRHDDPDRFARHHARDRGPDDRRDPCFRLVVSRLQHTSDATCRSSPIPAASSSSSGPFRCSMIMLLGGVIWIGSHDLDPAKPLGIEDAAARDPGRLTGLEVAVHLPEPAHRERQPAGGSRRRADPLLLTSASVMNAFFIPQLGSMIYTMNGMATQLNLQADAPGEFLGLSSHFSGDGFSDMHFDVQAVPADSSRLGRRDAQRHRPDARCREAIGDSRKQSLNVAPFTYRAVEPRCSRRSSHRQLPPGPGPDRARTGARAISARVSERRDSMLGKLTWSAIPFDQPIPLSRPALVGFGDHRRRSPGSRSRAGCPICGASGSPASITSGSASCTCLLAMVMLLRGFTDAIMMRSQQALAFRSPGLSAARALRPDLLGARHDDDLLRRHAVRDRADELRHAAAARRPRRGVSRRSTRSASG